MKSYILFIILTALIPTIASAQRMADDVIYLKDGTVYRGVIIDATYGISYRIKLANGKVIDLDAEQISRITKENDERSSADEYFNFKDKGYFFEMQLHLDVVGGGLRIINGYKFNQYAMLGLGIGAGGLYLAANGSTINRDNAPYAGFYLPFFIYYSGEILHKKATPFYVLETGYALAYDPLPGGADGANHISYNTLNGGPMGSAGFGLRIYSGKKFVFSISANLDFQYAKTDVYYASTGYSTNYIPPTDVYSHMILLLPGLKIGLGLAK